MEAGGQVVIITGAGTGLGLAVVTSMVASSKISHIFAVDLVVEALELLQAEASGKLTVMQGDISPDSGMEMNRKLVEAAVERFGRINAILLNAAMVKPLGRINQTPLKDWKCAWDVTFFASIDMIQHAWPHLQKSKGCISFTSTSITLGPVETWVCYASTKNALNYLASCIPMEDPNVKSIAIHPGSVNTPGFDKVSKDPSLSESVRSFLKQLKEEGSLLDPLVPAEAFVKVAESGVPHVLNGKMVSWEDVLNVNDRAEV